jgi:hypothetical protein
MEELVHADIFFFITSIAVVVVAIVLVVAIVYLIQILHDVRHVSRRIRDESEAIWRDIEALRTVVKTEGFKFRHLISFFFGLATKKERRSLRKRKKDEEDS